MQQYDVKLVGRNTGVSLLKLFMSFVVILTHFGTDKATVFRYFGESAVPCFMLVSFYLTSGLFSDPTPERLRQRLLRLAYPLLLWSIAYFLLMLMLGRPDVSFSQLMYSTLFGSSRSLNPTMWFLGAQLYITVFIFILSYVLPDRRESGIAICIVILFCFVFQYTGANGALYSSSNYEVAYLFGRLAETLPFALTGLLLRRYFSLLNRRRFIVLNILLIVLILLSSALPFPQGFGYGGIVTFLWSALISVDMIRLPQIKSDKLAYWLNYFAQYTLGIYCIHYAVGQLLEGIGRYLGISLGQGLLVFDILIWTCSLAASMLIAALGKKLKPLRYMVI